MELSFCCIADSSDLYMNRFHGKSQYKAFFLQIFSGDCTSMQVAEDNDISTGNNFCSFFNITNYYNTFFYFKCLTTPNVSVKKQVVIF